MRSPVVVIASPSRGELSRRRQTLKLFDGQELVSQSPVEAFGVAALEAARLYVQRLDADAGQPGANRAGDELRAVVAANALGNAAHRQQLRRPVDDGSLMIPRSTLQARTFADELVDDRDPLEGAAGRRPVERKLPAPDVVQSPRRDAGATCAQGPGATPFGGALDEKPPSVKNAGASGRADPGVETRQPEAIVMV